MNFMKREGRLFAHIKIFENIAHYSLKLVQKYYQYGDLKRNLYRNI